MRCDVNVSVRPKGEQRLRTRVEIKNMNSLTSMQKAIEFETTRQVLLCLGHTLAVMACFALQRLLKGRGSGQHRCAGGAYRGGPGGRDSAGDAAV